MVTQAKRRFSCAAAFGLLALCALPAAAVPISIDTSALANTAAHFTLNLLDGDGAPNNTARIFNLQTDGQLQGTTCAVGCTDVPAFTLDDTLGLGEFIQEPVLGTYLSFELIFTNLVDASGAGPDLVIGNLLDGNGFSLLSTELNDFNGPVPYADALFVANSGNGRVIGARGITTVPEPGVLALVVTGVAALAARRAHRTPQ